MIPKKIHFCWLSGDPYPPLIQHCLKSWEEYLSDYEIIIWDLSKFDIESSIWVKQAFENKKYAFAADYIRLYALYTEGGIYLDSDVEVFGTFNDMLGLSSFIGLETSGDFEPAIIGAEKNMSWIQTCLAYYKDKSFIQPNGTFETTPLPTIVGNSLKKYYDIEPKVGIYPDCQLKIFPAEYFSPKSIHTKQIIKSDKTISVHHFDGAWVEKNFRYKIKSLVHSILIFFFGQSMHNKLVKSIRKS